MKHPVKHKLRLSIALLLLALLLPTHQALAFGPNNAAADLSKWYGITGDYLNATGLEGFVIDDLKNSLTSVCYGLTLGQVIVDIAWGDYTKAWDTCQQTGIDTAIGATAASPFYAAGKLVWSSLQSVQDTAMKSFTGKLFNRYRDIRRGSVNWDKVRQNKPSDWLPGWLAGGQQDFNDYWYYFGDSGALNATYRNFLITKMKSDCGFTARLATFGTCNEDFMRIDFSDKEIKQWLYNSWEPLIIKEVMNEAVSKRREYLADLKEKTTFLITWSIEVDLGEPEWSSFNGHKGVKNGDQYSLKLNYLQGIYALGKTKWSIGYGTQSVGILGSMPMNAAKITPPRNLNMSKGTGSQVVLDIGKVLISSSQGLLSVKNTSDESVSILNFPIGSIPAKSEKTMWIPEGRYRLKTSIGIRSASIKAGRKTKLVLSKPSPPPPPPPTQDSVKARIDQLIGKIRSGNMGKGIGLEEGYSWNDHTSLILLETKDVEARITDPDGTQSMGNLGRWASGYIADKELAFKKEANAQCNGSLVNELDLLSLQNQSFEKDRILMFGYGSNRHDDFYRDMPEPGSLDWGNPPHGRDGRPKSRMISEIWLEKLDKSRTHIEEVDDAKKRRISDLEDWSSTVKNTIESMEKRYLFLNDWSSEGACSKLEEKAFRLSNLADYEAVRQLHRLEKEREDIDELMTMLQEDRSRLNKAISAYKKAVVVVSSDISNLHNQCRETVNVTENVILAIKEVKERFNIGKFTHMRLPIVDDETAFGQVRMAWADKLQDWWEVFPEENLPKPLGGAGYTYFIEQDDPTQKYIDFTRSNIVQLAQAYARSHKVNDLMTMKDRINGDAMEDSEANVLKRWVESAECMDRLKFSHGLPCTECPDLLGKLAALKKWWNDHKDLLTSPLPSQVKPQPQPNTSSYSKPALKPVEINGGTIKVVLDLERGIKASQVKARVLDKRGNLVVKGMGPHNLEPGKYVVNTYGMYMNTDPESAHIQLAAGREKVVKVRVWQDEEEEDDNYDGAISAPSKKTNSHTIDETHVLDPKTNDPKVIGDPAIAGAALNNRLVSGTYRVDVKTGPGYDSDWQLNVSSGNISGKSSWSCCPGPRSDPMQGRISNDTVRIERDCTGQGHTGKCLQVFTGKVNGNVIEGDFTHNGSGMGSWTLYLDDSNASNNMGSKMTGQSSLSGPAGEPSAGLGERWDVTEPAGWTGVWLRRGKSNVFDAIWTLGGKQEKAVLTISTHGNTVDVKRQQSPGSSFAGQECAYKGTLSADNVTVTGTYGCAWASGPFNWRAAIRRDSRGEIGGDSGGNIIDLDTGSIRVVSATYGSNCGVARGNVTPHIARQCNGKSTCSYTVDHKIIGDPAFGCAKTYSVRYQCDNNPRVFEKSLAAEAGLGNKAVALECAESGFETPAKLTGQWSVNQSNGFKGKLDLQQDSTDRLTGKAAWNGYLDGTIAGKVSGKVVTFTISYPDGVKGYYKGTLTQDGNKLVNGTAKGSNGDSATWDAVWNSSDTDTGWQTAQKASHSSINPKAKQWSSSGGGFMIMSGSHNFNKMWYRRTWGEKDPFYSNGEDTKFPPRHSHAEVMQQAIIKQGRVTVRGPGHLALYGRVKGPGAWVKLYDHSTGHRFHPQSGGNQTMYRSKVWTWKNNDWNGSWSGKWTGNVNDLYGNKPMGGWVPANKIVTYDVVIDQGWYNNMNVPFGSMGFGAPQEIDYELWFFPREGGGVKWENHPGSASTTGTLPPAQEIKEVTTGDGKKQ